MKPQTKIFLFFITFSLGFFVLRTQGAAIYYNVQTLVNDLGGLTYLYATIGMIFAIFAAFVILSEAERWNKLVDAIQGETGALYQLWLWSHHLPAAFKKRFSSDIQNYIGLVINEEWQLSKEDQKSFALEDTLESIHTNIYAISKKYPESIQQANSGFSELITYREKRIHYVSFALPKMLKQTLFFADTLLVTLSLLIGVKNAALDYIFVISVAMLCFVIYLLVEDMDNPTKKGGWHITTKDYTNLLQKVSK